MDNCKCVLSAVNGRFSPALDQAALKQSRTKLFSLLGKEAVAALFLLWLWRCKFLMAVNRIGWFVYSTGGDVTHQWKKKNCSLHAWRLLLSPLHWGNREKNCTKKWSFTYARIWRFYTSEILKLSKDDCTPLHFVHSVHHCMLQIIASQI